MYYDKLTSILYFQVCYSFRPISFHHSSALVPLCPLLWLLHNASSQQSLPSYRALQLGWIDRGTILWTCPEEGRRFLFWVHTLFCLCLYLFRCKSAPQKSLCSGRRTGAHLVEEVSPVEIGAAQIVLHYEAVIDVREVTSCSLTLTRQCWWEKYPHPALIHYSAQ